MKKTTMVTLLIASTFMANHAFAKERTSFFAHKKKSSAITVPNVNTFNNNVANNQKCVAAGQASCNGEDISRFYAGGDPTASRQAIKESLSTNNAWAPPKEPNYIPQTPATVSTNETTQPFYYQNQDKSKDQQANAKQAPSSATNTGILFPSHTNSSGSGASSSGGNDFIIN